MDNSEAQSTLGTKHKTRTKNKIKKTQHRKLNRRAALTNQHNLKKLHR
jgi:hypothetical protein